MRLQSAAAAALLVAGASAKPHAAHHVRRQATPCPSKADAAGGVLPVPVVANPGVAMPTGAIPTSAVPVPPAAPPVAPAPPVVVPPPAGGGAAPNNTAPGVPIQGPGVPIGSIITKCTQPGTFALTYDDGPFDFTTTVLDQLDAAGIKATFFVNGNNVGNINTYAAVIQRMDAGGHQVGSHTFSHADLVTLGDSDVILEMTRLETDLINIMGKYGTYMRPPFFSTNPATLNTLGLLGYHVVQADIDTLDFANKEPVGNLTGATNFKTGIAGGGTIALAHDIHQNTAQVLTPEFIRSITASGLRGVTVGDCLGDPPSNWYNGTRTSTPVGTQPASTISITSTSTPTGILTTDTTCGGASGFVCAPGDCCSQFGFCGTSAQHCGTGCNPLFGVCGAFVPVDPNAPPPPPVQTGGISPDSSCGGANAFTCPEGNCCSQFGFCGTTAEHCGTGCQAPFGQCGTPAAPVSSAVPAAPVAPAA